MAPGATRRTVLLVPARCAVPVGRCRCLCSPKAERILVGQLETERSPVVLFFQLVWVHGPEVGILPEHFQWFGDAKYSQSGLLGLKIGQELELAVPI